MRVTHERSIVDIGALQALIDERIEAALAERGIAVEYSSVALPPGISRRAFNSWCRTGKVHGAQRDGAGWRCTAAAWRAARAGAAVAAPRKAAAAAAANDIDDVDALLLGAGLRATR